MSVPAIEAAPRNRMVMGGALTTLFGFAALVTTAGLYWALSRAQTRSPNLLTATIVTGSAGVVTLFVGTVTWVVARTDRDANAGYHNRRVQALEETLQAQRTQMQTEHQTLQQRVARVRAQLVADQTHLETAIARHHEQEQGRRLSKEAPATPTKSAKGDLRHAQMAAETNRAMQAERTAHLMTRRQHIEQMLGILGEEAVPSTESAPAQAAPAKEIGFPAYNSSRPLSDYVGQITVRVNDLYPCLEAVRREAEQGIKTSVPEAEVWLRLAHVEDALREGHAGLQELGRSWILNPQYEQARTVQEYAAQVEQATAALIVLSDQRVWASLAVTVPPMSVLLGALTAHCSVLNKKPEELPAALRGDRDAEKIRAAAQKAVDDFDTPLSLGARAVITTVGLVLNPIVRSRTAGLKTVTEGLPEGAEYAQVAAAMDGLVTALRNWQRGFTGKGRPLRDFSEPTQRACARLLGVIGNLPVQTQAQREANQRVQDAVRRLMQPDVRVAKFDNTIQRKMVAPKLPVLNALRAEITNFKPST